MTMAIGGAIVKTMGMFLCRTEQHHWYRRTVRRIKSLA